MLGPVEVQGVPPINRRRTTELITYLALHPGGVSAERLKTAIWPDAEPSQDTFNVTVHRARSALGTDADGNHSLPHAVTNGGTYSLGPHVVTDLHRFNELVRRARSTDDSSVEADCCETRSACCAARCSRGSGLRVGVHRSDRHRGGSHHLRRRSPTRPARAGPRRRRRSELGGDTGTEGGSGKRASVPRPDGSCSSHGDPLRSTASSTSCAATSRRSKPLDDLHLTRRAVAAPRSSAWGSRYRRRPAWTLVADQHLDAFRSPRAPRATLISSSVPRRRASASSISARTRGATSWTYLRQVLGIGRAAPLPRLALEPLRGTRRNGSDRPWLSAASRRLGSSPLVPPLRSLRSEITAAARQRCGRLGRGGCTSRQACAAS